ncbi:MAG TPA: peptidase M48, partial [Balneola sp.]|nr:peptidase M48 [Balneola sp.]
MNIYAIIILATIAVDFVLDLVSNYLNLKSLSKELPDEFEGVYDEETYAKSQEYTK